MSALLPNGYESWVVRCLLFGARSPCKTHGPSGPGAWPLVTHPTLQVASWQLLEASITLGQIYRCLPTPILTTLFIPHTYTKPNTSLIYTTSFQHSALQSLYYTNTTYQPTSSLTMPAMVEFPPCPGPPPNRPLPPLPK